MGTGFSRQKRRGTWFVVLALIMLPLLVSAIVAVAFDRAGLNIHGRLNVAQIHIFGGAAGTLFVLCFWIAGGVRQGFAALAERIKEFKENVEILGLGFSIGEYWAAVKEKGIEFTVYFWLSAANVAYFLYGLLRFLKIIGRI